MNVQSFMSQTVCGHALHIFDSKVASWALDDGADARLIFGEPSKRRCAPMPSMRQVSMPWKSRWVSTNSPIQIISGVNSGSLSRAAMNTDPFDGIDHKSRGFGYQLFDLAKRHKMLRWCTGAVHWLAYTDHSATFFCGAA